MESSETSIIPSDKLLTNEGQDKAALFKQYPQLGRMGTILNDYIARARTPDHIDTVAHFISDALPVAAVHALKENYSVNDLPQALLITRTLQDTLNHSLLIHKQLLAKDTLPDLLYSSNDLVDAIQKLSAEEQDAYLNTLTSIPTLGSEEELDIVLVAATNRLQKLRLSTHMSEHDGSILSYNLLSQAQDMRLRMNEIPEIETETSDQKSERQKDALFKKALSEAITYLRYCSSSAAPTKYATEALVWLGMSVRDRKLLRNGREIAEQFWDRLVGREGNVGDPRLSSEAAAFPIITEPSDPESFKKLSHEQVWAGHTFGLLQERLRECTVIHKDELVRLKQEHLQLLQTAPIKNDPISYRDYLYAHGSKDLQQDALVKITTFVDEKYRNDTEYDLLSLYSLPNDNIRTEYLSEYVTGKLRLNDSSTFQQIVLTENARTELNSAAYMPRKARNKNLEYKKFHDPRTAYILNLYTDAIPPTEKLYRSPFFTVGDASKNTTISLRDGTTYHKYNHTVYDGAQVLRPTVELSSRAQQIGKTLRIEGFLPSHVKTETPPSTVSPLLEYVEFVIYNREVPKIIYSDSAGHEHKRSPTFILSTAIAMALSPKAEHFHMLYDSKYRASTQIDPRRGNVQPALMLSTHFQDNSSLRSREDFDIYNQLVTKDAQRCVDGLSTPAVLKAPLGDATDPIAPVAQALDPDLRLLRNAFMVSPAPILARDVDTKFRTHLDNVRIKGFVTSRSSAYQNPGDNEPRGGVVGYTSQPSYSSEIPEQKISIKVEVGDLDDQIVKVAQEMCPVAKDEKRFIALIRSIAKDWQELTVGEMPLETYQRKLGQNFNRFQEFQKGFSRGDHYIPRSNYPIDSPETFQHELNLAIMRDGAAARAIKLEDHLEENIQKIKQAYQRNSF